MDYILNIEPGRALLLTFLMLLALSAIVYVFLLQTNYIMKKSINLSDDKIVVFVTAHPDDECMFFAPAVLKTAGKNPKNVHLLCLTTGDYYKQGKIREKELHKSCRLLGVLASNIKILDNSSFLDGSRNWDFNVLVPELLEYVKQVNPDYIFTFDDYGVSGHTNHIGASVAARQLCRYRQSIDKMPAIFELESVPLYRKYLSFMDIPISVISSRLSFLSSPLGVLKAQRAMLAHRTQLVWYRGLYNIFSRYMLINTFKEVPLEPSSNAS